jgi:hypothetical protein
VSRPEIPDGDFYTCIDGGDEHLTHTDPAEAVEYYLDGFLSARFDVRAAIAQACPLTLTAYKRDEVCVNELAGTMAARLSEEAAETWNDEHGGPDGQMSLDERAVKAFETAVRLLLASLYASGASWNCSPCGSVELSADDVAELMGEEWLAVSGEGAGEVTP